LLSNNNKEAYYNRGISRFKTNDIEGACSDWKKAKELGDRFAKDLIKKYCTE